MNPIDLPLGELRALRDAYRPKAVRALENRWRKPMAAFIDECGQRPLVHAAGVAVLADTITDLTDWAALTRFMWLADLVWEKESEAMDAQPFKAWKRRAA